MSDFAASVSPTAPLPDSGLADGLLNMVFEVALTGIGLLRPVFGADGTTIVDLAYVRLNAAAQAMLKLPECPTETVLELFPHALDTGAFAFYCDVFQSGQAGHFSLNYQHDGMDNYYHLAARRYGELLVISFTDTADHERSAIEIALRASQARERAAHAEAEVQRGQLNALFMQAPACIAMFVGPTHICTLANKPFHRLFGERPLLDKPIREAMPELEGQPFFGLLDEVYRSGETFYGKEMVAYLDQTNIGRLDAVYFDYIYQATHDAAGVVSGILIFAHDVSEQVLVRQRLEATEQDMASFNEELSASNESLFSTNEALVLAHAMQQEAQQALHELNEELEVRIVARTAELQTALLATEHQRETFHQVFEQTPALISILRGPVHCMEYINPAFQRLYAGRQLVGLPLAEGMPEAVAQGFMGLLDQLYSSGETFQATDVLGLMADANGQVHERYFNYTYQPFQEQGHTVGISVFAFDVTEQVLGRQQLVAQQARLVALFEQAPVAITVLRGADYVIEVANPGVCALWGRTPAQLVGRPLFEALPEINNQGFRELLDNVLATGIAFAAQEVVAQLAGNDGPKTVFLNFVYQPLHDTDGTISSVGVVAADVTVQVLARRQLETRTHELETRTQQLEQRTHELATANATLLTANADTLAANAALSLNNQQLTRTNADLDTFVYAASHDLKQPVNNLAALFTELRQGITFHDPAEEQLLLPMIEQSLRQLTTTIEDLAMLGQVQQVSAGLAEPVNLAALVQEILQTLEPQVRAARARISTDFAVRPTILYPRPSLHTILLNLLSNALKYADPARPARIHLSLWLEAGQPVLVVKDNGLGFDAAGHEAELFQLFRRFHSHTEGTGVGLYLVNRIVQANGGSITVESAVGEGATFRVALGG